MDEWGAGCYEDTASELEPAARDAVAALALRGGERVLDVACGTGNAALVAARAGAVVTGIDTSPRLLDVARSRVPGGEFVHGDAARLPFADASFDAVVSVFGVIFARPAQRGVEELARVVRDGGRVAITTWPPRGPYFGAISVMRAALGRVRPPDDGPRVDWGDPVALEALLAPYGAVTIGEHMLPIAPETPRETWERWERLHPMWIAARRELEPAGAWPALREATMNELGRGTEGAAAETPYLLAVLERTRSSRVRRAGARVTPGS